MLIKNDLLQITKIVQAETTKIVQSETRKIVQEELEPIKKRLEKVEEAVVDLKKGQRRIEKNLKDGFNFLDRDLTPRMKRVENYLGLPPLSPSK